MGKCKLVGVCFCSFLLFLGSSAPSQTQCELPTPLAISGISERPVAILGLAPQAVVVEDFNLDGRLDFAVSYLRCDPEWRSLDPIGCSEDDRNGRVALFLGQRVTRDALPLPQKVAFFRQCEPPRGHRRIAPLYDCRRLQWRLLPRSGCL